MKQLKKIVLYTCIISLWHLISLPSAAQTFEYIQNKGQWESEILYKGELSSGAFFLMNNGYRVVQHHAAELALIKAKMTGHHHQSSANASSFAQNALANAANLAMVNEEESFTLRSHAYDVKFLGCNPKASMLGKKEMPGYYNYIKGNDSSRWAGQVKSYGEVWFQSLYPGIDVRYYSDEGFLKYDIVVQPNAPIEKLALQYIGVDKLSIKNGELLVKTSVAEIKERAPYSYQLKNGLRQEVACKYELIGNIVRYKLSGYDPSQVLVIDPTLIFSSFTGSTSDNWGYSATYDRTGNLYAGGIVFATGFPVTPGAYQTTFGGGGNTGEGKPFDIAIMKFNATGTQRVYATLIGGNGNEFPHSLVVDNANNLVIAGRTTSPNYPITRAAIGPGGAWDIVVTKLNATGSGLVGSIRIGGTSDDGVNIQNKYPNLNAISLQRNYGDDSRSEVILDRAGNVLVASSTQSDNFPVTAGVFQPTKGTSQDAVLLKFSANLGTTLFASFLGGSANDAAYVLAEAPTGNIFIAGGTESSNFPGNKSGTVGPAISGVIDGFVAEVTSNGSSLVRSTFIGTNGIDQVYGVQFDANGFLYIMGTATGNFPVRNAPFSQNGGKQFIAKLQSDLSAYIYSTVFGTNSLLPNISPTAFLVDICENVYVSGWGGNVTNQPSQGFPNATTVGLTLTPDAFQTGTDGADFYFFVLEKDATRQLFGSFFGQLQLPGQPITGDHVDGGTSRFDADGVIYQAQCANCSGGQFPITPGVVGPTNPSGACNQAVLKVAFNLSGIRSGVKSSILNVDGDTTACVPATVDFRDTLALATRYEWDFGDGTSTVTNVPNISHTFNSVGIFRVMLVSVDSTKCRPRDTSFVNIRVRDDFAPVLATSTKLPPCQDNNYRFDNLSVAPPGKPFQANSFTWIFGDNTPPLITGPGPVTHQFASAGTFNVRLVLTDTNYCNAIDTFRLTLRVSPLVEALFNSPPSGCAPFNAQFDNTSLGGQQFFWSFGDGGTSTAVSPAHVYTNPGNYRVKLIAIDSNTCNIIDSTETSIIISGAPNALFTFTPNPPQENIITTFINQSDVVPEYRWFFGDGDSLYTFTRDTIVRHQYRQSGTFNACLVAINQFGCPDTFCLPITAIVFPLVDVVSAFTPNGDGSNDRAVVFGYGIAKLTFRIFNRWGQLMFETNDPRRGWDGRFNGKPQPMDAYAYTIDAELINGDKVKRSGSVTLIR